jgi:hypothetical protein
MRALIVAALAALASSEASYGRNEPFFAVSMCSWEATDILILAPTTSKATFRVLETIRGDQQPGVLLVLAELAPPDDIAAFREQRERTQSSPEPPPAMQPGERMIVCLLRAGAQHEFFSPPVSPITDDWQPADASGDMRFSAVWLRNGDLLAFSQIGIEEAGLHDLLVTEQEFRHQIVVGIQLRASLDRALEFPADSVARAVQLAELVRAGDVIASLSALKHLAASGSAAGVILRELLADPKLLPLQSEIERALKNNDYRNAGQVLF